MYVRTYKIFMFLICLGFHSFDEIKELRQDKIPPGGRKMIKVSRFVLDTHNRIAIIGDSIIKNFIKPGRKYLYHKRYVCMYANMYVSMYVCMYVCINVCMYVCVYACVYVCIYVCMYVGMYVCMYVCM